MPKYETKNFITSYRINKKDDADEEAADFIAADAIEACIDAGYSPAFMPFIVDEIIKAKKDWFRFNRKYTSASLIITGKTKPTDRNNRGTPVIVISHVSHYLSDLKNMQLAKSQGLVNGAARIPYAEFQKLLELRDDKNIFVIDYSKLEYNVYDAKGLVRFVIKAPTSWVDSYPPYDLKYEGLALEHPLVIPFLGGEERAIEYFDKLYARIGNRTISIDYNRKDLSDQPVGRLLEIASCGSVLSADSPLIEKSMHIDKFILGVRKIRTEEDLTYPKKDIDQAIISVALSCIDTSKLEALIKAELEKQTSFQKQKLICSEEDIYEAIEFLGLFHKAILRKKIREIPS